MVQSPGAIWSAKTSQKSVLGDIQQEKLLLHVYCCLAAVSRGGIVIDVYWCSRANYHWASEGCCYGGKSSLKKSSNPTWKKTFGILNEKVHSLDIWRPWSLIRAAPYLPLVRLMLTRKFHLNEDLSLFHASTSFSLYLPFPLILVLSFFSHIEVIPFYVFLQQLNQDRQCAKVNDSIALFSPYKSSYVIHSTLWAKIHCFIVLCSLCVNG